MDIALSVRDIGEGCYLIDDRERTVAIVTSQGYVDWLLRSPNEAGPKLDGIRKETHLSYTLGLKLLLVMPTPATKLTSVECTIAQDQRSLVLTGIAETADGAFRSLTTAELHCNPETECYEWLVNTQMTCTASEPQELHWLEYNNIYPAFTGRCMLYAPEKRYHSTLMLDGDGVIWDFPHQHTMHYWKKTNELQFATDTWSGFFGEQDGSPVCVVHESTLPPDWQICDMYYDLHCGARPQGAFQPGEQHDFRYTIKYLTPAESASLIAAARSIPVDTDDHERYNYPKLELGMNHFDGVAPIDRLSDASCFRVSEPKRAWDQEICEGRKGALRIQHDDDVQETVWSAVPPTEIPENSTLTISALVKTTNVEGAGISLRVRYHTFHWHPTPHVEWVKDLCSDTVSGDSDWVRISTPPLEVPAEDFDYLVYIDVILEGTGTAWLTDCDVDLVRHPALVPV